MFTMTIKLLSFNVIIALVACGCSSTVKDSNDMIKKDNIGSSKTEIFSVCCTNVYVCEVELISLKQE